jgi:aspartate-semialdehyde dehydrogenase
MPNTYTVAILGATGLVGTYLRELLEAREFPLKELRLLASERSAGERLAFKGDWLTVEAVSEAAFKGVDIVLASAGGAISEQWVPVAVQQGAVVVDNTSYFRLKEDVPLVVAGVNDADLQHHKGIIANPNCSTAQLMPVLKALNDAIGLKRVSC